MDNNKPQKSGPKDKRRNNEKRKEKSRDAARSRRSKETEVFTDLGQALPLTHEQVSQLDKASIMRLAIAYLRVRDMLNLVPDELTEEEPDSKLLLDDSIFLKSLEGFLLVLSPDGDIVYMSENVSDYLGITQIDLMGQNMYEYSHPCDHDEIKDILQSKTKDPNNYQSKSFFIRMKCTLTSKGRSVNLKSATYKVIHCTGHLIEGIDNETGLDDESIDNKNDEQVKKDGTLKRCLVAIGKPIPHPSNIEAPLPPRQTFLTKHSLDMKFTHADDQIMMDLLGYNADDLVGKSVYDYHHAMDSDSICANFKCLFSKGQCETTRYRFLAKTGGYVWVLTQATLIYDNKMMKPQSVVCVNYVISGVECKDEIYSSAQLASVKTENLCNNNNNNNIVTESVVVETVVNNKTKGLTNEKLIASTSIPTIIAIEDTIKIEAATITNRKICEPIVIDTTNNNNKQPSSKSVETSSEKFLLPRPSLAQTATSKIFAPRTEEMNKGFLTFSEDEPGLTMLKDEPEDLTHLAPVAGDVCVPLDDHPFLTDMMLDDFLLRDNFSPLLADEPTDPFISYRDSYDNSPQLLSPNLSKVSECSLPSLNSPSDSLSDEDRMSTFMNLQMDDDSELMSKTPYITLNMNEDLPLLMSDDLMWSSNERIALSKSNGTVANVGGVVGSNAATTMTLDSSSSLAQLLCSSMNKNNKTHEGGLIQNDEFYTTTNNKNKKNLQMDVKSGGNRVERSTKRTNSSTVYDSTTKRSRTNAIEPKEKMSSELLQRLMSNNHHRGRPKGKSNWLLDGGGQKAACISQPSDSVLMNLLDDPMMGPMETSDDRLVPINDPTADSKDSSAEEQLTAHQQTIRKNSLSLLDPESTIPSLLDLSQQDFEVNAPVNNLLLQGTDILSALDVSSGI